VKPPSSPFRSAPTGEPARGFTAGPGEHVHSLRVRYADSDQMGVAYYANYLVWFEVGRTEWLRSRGYAYRTLESEGVFLPVTEAVCRYLAPCRYDDLLYVVTSVGRLGRTVVRFDYRVHKEDGTLAAVGHTQHCFLSRAGRPVRAPEEISRRLASGLAAAP
jgi:acyl-CoA thioester hydrolase